MRQSLTATLACLLLSQSLPGQLIEKTIRYSLGDSSFESTVVFDNQRTSLRPAILMIPNWMGPTPASLQKAKDIAGTDYVVMMVDVYGTDVRPQNSGEAGEAAATLRSNRPLMRQRVAAGHRALLELADSLPVNPSKIAAIGFCFGGGAVLEYARTGADIAAVVSFHGDLLSPTLSTDAASTRAKVLVLHGAADPYVPQSDVRQFVDVMLGTSVDWTLVQFSGAVHSFTDPQARTPGKAQYNPVVAERAFEMMDELFEEIFDEDD